jgi:hypothetical protein
MSKGEGQAKSKSVILSPDELMNLLDVVKHENIQSGYSYINYAPYPVTVLEKLFLPYGQFGDSRDDITENEIRVIKRGKLITEGILGQNTDEPTDGSFSDKQLNVIANYEFEQFEEAVSRIWGEITLNRLVAVCVKLEKPSKYEKICLSRIGELSHMKARPSDHVEENIYKPKA